MNRPEVRAKVSAAHLPFRGRFDPGGELRRAKHLPGHDFMEAGVALPAKPPAQLFDGKGEKRTNILLHAIHTMPPLGRVKPGCTDSQKGLTQEQVAERLGISLDHMRNTLYRKGKRLGVDILARAAALFGCSSSGGVFFCLKIFFDLTLALCLAWAYSVPVENIDPRHQSEDHMDTTASLNCHLRQIAAAASRLASLKGAGRKQAMRDLASNCKYLWSSSVGRPEQ